VGTAERATREAQLLQKHGALRWQAHSVSHCSTFSMFVNNWDRWDRHEHRNILIRSIRVYWRNIYTCVLNRQIHFEYSVPSWLPELASTTNRHIKWLQKVKKTPIFLTKNTKWLRDSLKALSTKSVGRHSLTELRVICSVATGWGKQYHQPRGFIPIRRNQSQKVATAVLIQVTTNVRNHNHQDPMHVFRHTAPSALTNQLYTRASVMFP